MMELSVLARVVIGVVKLPSGVETAESVGHAQTGVCWPLLLPLERPMQLTLAQGLEYVFSGRMRFWPAQSSSSVHRPPLGNS